MSATLNPAPLATKDVKHYEYLNSLRGWAVLGVLMVHVSLAITGLNMLTKNFAGYGRMGVQLFFVLSAFTLIMSMRKRSKHETRPLANYFVRRLFRIAPLFWMALIFYSIVRVKGPTPDIPYGIHWQQILMTATFTHGWTPLSINSVVPGDWSIAAEMGFYLLLPVLALIATDLRKALGYTTLALIASIGIDYVALKLLTPAWQGSIRAPLLIYMIYLWLPTQLPVFLLGIATYYSVHNMNLRELPVQKKRLFSLAGLAVAASIALAATDLSRTNTAVSISVYTTLFGLAFALFTWALSLVPWRIFVNPALSYAGTISFSCYLIQFYVIRIYIHFVHHTGALHGLRGFAIAYIVVVATTLFLATFTYRYIEESGIALGKRVIAWNENRAKSATPMEDKIMVEIV